MIIDIGPLVLAANLWLSFVVIRWQWRQLDPEAREALRRLWARIVAVLADGTLDV